MDINKKIIRRFYTGTEYYIDEFYKKNGFTELCDHVSL